MSRAGALRMCYSLFLIGLSVWYSVYTIMAADGLCGQIIGSLGAFYTMVAIVVTMNWYRSKNLATYIRDLWFLFLPVSFVPVLGAWDAQFPGSGLAALVWPAMLAIFMVWNRPLLSWAQPEQSA